jgi:hypothetical protein
MYQNIGRTDKMTICPNKGCESSELHLLHGAEKALRDECESGRVNVSRFGILSEL